MDDLELDAERRRVGLSFLGIAMLAPLLTLLPPDSDLTPVAVTVYLALTVGSGLISRIWWDRIEVVAGPTAAVYVLAVALLRHAEGGGASGLTPLLLLALFWCSLVGGRSSLGLVVASMGFALLAPIVLVGDPAYPVTEWRRAVVWLTVAPIVGLATLSLRRRADEARQAVTALARTDALTGCLNRRGLDEVAERELARGRRTGNPLSVALLDIDHFKRFNDTRGHDAGDDLLRQAAAAWQTAVRDTDVVARWGGEEFVVLLPDTPEAAAVDVLERLRARTPMEQTVSIGVTVATPEDTLADAVSRADTALYEAKESGRDRIVTTS